ncbi:MAG TPA: ribbon-helix-helix domain-containing protein [Gemmataceae bacterium]|jgi:hypothetical protein
MSQQQPCPEPPRGDCLDVIDIVVDDWGAPPPPPPPSGLSFQERLARRQVVDSYAIHPEKLARVKEAAIRLGRDRSDLVREGLELVLEKYRDKLGDLDNPQPSSSAPKPDDVPPSA